MEVSQLVSVSSLALRLYPYIKGRPIVIVDVVEDCPTSRLICGSNYFDLVSSYSVSCDEASSYHCVSVTIHNPSSESIFVTSFRFYIFRQRWPWGRPRGKVVELESEGYRREVRPGGEVPLFPLGVDELLEILPEEWQQVSPLFLQCEVTFGDGTKRYSNIFTWKW